MNFRILPHLLLLAALLWAGSVCAATSDRYVGDTSIYSGTSIKLKPNVMILVDTSKNMAQGGGSEPYNPATTYPGPYASNAIYQQLNSNNYQFYVADATAAGVCADAQSALLTYGFYNKGLKKSSGNCSSKSADIGNYYLGNLLNKTQAPPPPVATWQASTLYQVGDTVKSTDATNTSTYRCIVAGYSGSTDPASTSSWPTSAGSTLTETPTDPTKTGVEWEMTASLMDVVKAVLKQASGALRQDIKLGLATVGPNNAGGWVRSEVKDVSHTTIDALGNTVVNTAGDANYTAFLNSIDNLAFIPSNTAMPMNEALYDMKAYYEGDNGDPTQKLASGASVYGAPSPIDYSCQKNYVLLLTTGASTPSPQAEGAVGDQDADGLSGRTDDTAKLLYESDMLPDLSSVAKTDGYQRVQTSVIQLMTSKVTELERATDGSHGRGDYFQANNTEQLTEDLLGLLNNIVREAETAFVAPVVPASPENRTYSGKRIYIGFFKPMSQQAWYGNLKKFGINDKLQIVSANGVDPATNADGTFNAGATSFWANDADLYTASGDAGNVQQGGVGGQLMVRDLVAEPRKIWTYTGGLDKTLSGNLVEESNGNLTTDKLGLASAADPAGERSKLIKYLQGFDGYNDNGYGDTAKRDWILGDILHSKPLVVNYQRYTLTTSNEADTAINQTYIFQGANDGMLHCFRDADGKEMWAFIPPDLLPRLQNLHDGTAHSYYVDGTPSVYIHDANNDGHIDGSVGDYALLIFGLRRGGGLQALSGTGFRGGYYALNVTDPANPVYLGEISNQIPGFGEMGETWAQPRLARVQIGTQRKIVAFISAGYDNVEDLRFGSIQSYPADTTQVPLPVGAPDSFTTAQSSGGYAPSYPRGRGIYAVEIADLDLNAGVYKPNFSNSGKLVWAYQHGFFSGYSGDTSQGIRTSPLLLHSIASDILALDMNTDGLVDRLYAGDTGGNLWRFNVGDTNVMNWSAKKVFSSNPGADLTVGRKLFYKPEATFEGGGRVMLYFGTGDRAHPMNYLNPGASGAVVDRLYAVRDDDANSSVLTESDLYDATADKLQQDLTPAQLQAERDALNAADGWYIKLSANAGEKALSPVSVFNRVVFYTTYQPDTAANIAAANNPCDPGNLGFSRLYAVDADTGEAVFNYVSDTGTDVFGENQATSTNKDAQGADADGNAYVLRRADRELSLGGGIPSGMVFVIGSNGSVSAITAANISFPVISMPGNGTIFPVFWTQW